MKPFKQLLGNRIYLEVPKREESVIELTPELEEARIKEEMKKYTRLKVYAVGDTINNIKEGEEVLIAPEVLTRSGIIPLSDDVNVILISVFDVVHIW